MLKSARLFTRKIPLELDELDEKKLQVEIVKRMRVRNGSGRSNRTLRTANRCNEALNSPHSGIEPLKFRPIICAAPGYSPAENLTELRAPAGRSAPRALASPDD